MVKVKICGITRLEDALAAGEAGADYLGLNFYPPSRRFIEPAEARKLVRAAGSLQVKWAGVFVNEKIDLVRRIAREADLDLVQLHGEESKEYCRDLAENNDRVEIIKVFRIKSGNDIKSPGRFPADYFLFDTYSPGYGGSGRVLDWGMLQGQKLPRKRLFLSGGLNPGNVGEAIRLVRPYAVDVASGVESSPGKKDRKMMIEFVKKVKNVQVS